MKTKMKTLGMIILIIFLFINFCFCQQIKEIVDFHYEIVVDQNRGLSYFQIEAEVVYQNDSLALYTEKIYSTSNDIKRFPYLTTIKNNTFIGTRCFSIEKIKHCKTEDSIPVFIPFNYNYANYLSKGIDTTYVLYFSKILQACLENSLYYNNDDTSLVYRFIIVENDTANVIRIQASQNGYEMAHKKMCLVNDESYYLLVNKTVQFPIRSMNKLRKVFSDGLNNQISPSLIIHYPNIFIEIRTKDTYYVRFKQKSELISEYNKGFKTIKRILYF